MAPKNEPPRLAGEWTDVIEGLKRQIDDLQQKLRERDARIEALETEVAVLLDVAR